MKKRTLFWVTLSLISVQIAFTQCITMQPTAAILCPVSGATINVSVASGSTAPTYTWQYRVITPTSANPAWITITNANANGVYSNYTSSDLGITKTGTLPKAGTQYRAIIGSPECGSTTSDSVNLYLLSPVKSGIIVADASVCLGNQITFSLFGYSGSSFQWESAPSSTGLFTPIVGETGITYTIPQAFLNMNKSYRVVVTDDACGSTAVTSVKTIKVDPISLPGIVTGGGTICPNSSTVLRLNGYVGRIQWEYSKNGVKFQKVPTVTSWNPLYPFQTSSTNLSSATYNVSNLAAPVFFRARVSSGLCSETFSNVVQCKTGTTALGGVISPSSNTICSGTSTNLILSGADGAVTWEKSINWSSTNPTWSPTTNHTNIMNTASQTVSTAYRAKVSVGSCSDLSTVVSNIAIVTIINSPLAKSITANNTSPSGTNPSNSLCTSDTSKVLTIGAGFVGEIQWQASPTSNTSDFVDIGGETFVSYTVSNAISGVNYYRAKFTNSCNNSVYSPIIALYYEDCGFGKINQNQYNSSPIWSVVAYPNPFAKSFTLHTNIFDVFTIKIFDNTGRLIENREVASSLIGDQSFGEDYPTGVYNLVILHDDEIKTLRIIKK